MSKSDKSEPAASEKSAKTDNETDSETSEAGEASQGDGNGEAQLRDKFREALERKRKQQDGKKSEGRGKKSSGIHDAHGPAVHKREFRRKSI